MVAPLGERYSNHAERRELACDVRTYTVQVPGTRIFDGLGIHMLHEHSLWMLGCAFGEAFPRISELAPMQ